MALVLPRRRGRTRRFSTFFLVENDEKVKSVFFQIMNGVQFSSSMLCKTMILYQLYLVKRTIWLLFSHVARYFYGDVGPDQFCRIILLVSPQ